MRIATWNVNSVRARAQRIVDWLGRNEVDALAMQEIKCKTEQFPYSVFEEAGYEVVAHGVNQWNGVAIASRIGISDAATTFAGMPGFEKGNEGPDLPLEPRALGATVGDADAGAAVRLWSLYVPNGRALDDPHYAYKLEWLAALRADAAAWMASSPDLPLALTGDFNIAPTDEDNGDPTIVAGVSTHVSVPEREAFRAFAEAGLVDVVRPLVPTGFTYWDYKQLRFPRNEGLRIDFVLGSPSLADLVTGASIDREERKGDAPSDHVPVVVDLDLDVEDDDRPMIF